MNNYLVSIIIPCFNVEKYVNKGIKSCIEQTYNNTEIICIDDGSKDKTSEIIDSFNDNRIKLIKTQNFGVSHARNIGIQNSNGNYCIFLDADDWLEINAIETLVNLQNNNPNKFIACSNYKLSNNCLIDESRKKDADVSRSKTIIENFGTGICNSQTSCCKLFDLSIIKKHNLLFDEELTNIEDGLFVYSYLHLVSEVSYFPIPLWIFFERENSTTTKKFNKNKLSSFVAIKKMMNDFDNDQIENENLNIYYIRTLRWAIIDAIYSDPKENLDIIIDLRNQVKIALKSKYCTRITLYDKLTLLILAFFPYKLTIFFMTAWKKIMRR